MVDLVIQILSSAWNLNLPFFNVSLGVFCIFIWSIPFVVKYTKMLF